MDGRKKYQKLDTNSILIIQSREKSTQAGEDVLEGSEFRVKEIKKVSYNINYKASKQFYSENDTAL